MEYTVQGLARLAGVSARTLRYYDQIGLLSPARHSSSGYRIYGKDEVDRLQQILFYRELDIPLDEIAGILEHPEFNRMTALQEHLIRLCTKRERLDTLIQTVQQSIAAEEGVFIMSDKQKFEGFKKELIAKNEESYGEEIRKKYGKEVIEASNAKLMGLSEEEYTSMMELEKKIIDLLEEAIADKNVHGEVARKLVQAHKNWLLYSWTEYSPKAHCGLAEMYAADTRFSDYYGGLEKAEFLRDAIMRWAEKLD